MQRNIYFAQLSTILIFFFFNRKKIFIDYAGGYGIFTRLMRDNGYNFLWHDPYTHNIMARGFEYNEKTNDEVELVTSFESFEHFVEPYTQIEKMLQLSKNILFSTNLLPKPAPKPGDWWYYGLEHGQHISFYSVRNLKVIANKYNLYFYSNGVNLHLFTSKKLPGNIFKILHLFRKLGMYLLVKRVTNTKTFSDMQLLLSQVKDENNL